MPRAPVWLLDSGAYSAHTTGAKITVEEYVKFVHANGHKFAGGAINLDVVRNKRLSYDRWLQLKDLGVDSIPVFHVGPDLEKTETKFHYLDLYLKQTNYIAIAAVAKLSVPKRIIYLDHLWDYLRSIGADKTHRFHVLGVTSMTLLDRHPWFSADSSTAIMNAANGKILLPAFKSNGEKDFLQIRPYVVSAQGKHKVGTNSSLYGLPSGGIEQTNIYKYCEEIGYPIDKTIEGVKLTPRRSRPHENRYGSYSLGVNLQKEVAEQDGETLGNSYNLREKFNHAFFIRACTALREKNKDFRLYTVLSGPPQISNYLERCAVDDATPYILMSYWYIKAKRMKIPGLSLEMPS